MKTFPRQDMTACGKICMYFISICNFFEIIIVAYFWWSTVVEGGSFTVNDIRNDFFNDIYKLLEDARKNVKKAVNLAMVY